MQASTAAGFTETETENIKAERPGGETGQNKLICIFVGWLEEVFLGKISPSIDDVTPEGTVKRASSLVIPL